MKCRCSNLHSSRGFTLIEVLIAMAIMAFISLGIYQATVETYKLRDSLSVEGAFYNTIRLAMSIVQKDVALMYCPGVQLPKSIFNRVAPSPPPQIEPLPGEDFMIPNNFWSMPVHESGLRPSRFIGSDVKMSFISLSNSRIYRDTPGSEFAKITYELKPEDKDPALKGTFVLIKTESSNAFARSDSRDPFLVSHDLLHGVKKLAFSYLFRDGNTWKTVKSWDSDQDQPRFNFPDMIVIDLEVMGSRTMSFEGKFKLRPEIPFNGIPSIF